MRILDQPAVERLLSGLTGRPRVVCGGSGAAPLAVLDLMDRACETWRLACINAPAGVPNRPGVTHETVFIGPGARGTSPVRFIPCRLSLAPRLYRNELAPDVLVLHTSMPRNGRVSMGIEVQVLPAALDEAKRRGALVIAQLNPNMPHVLGDGVIDVHDIDVGMVVDAPLPTASMPSPGPIASHIGDLVVGRIPDGATLQVGIGVIPDAVVAKLPRAHRVGVWTELLTDGIHTLEEAHSLDERMIVGTFAMGTPRLYEWLDDNPRVQLLRCETTNDPGIIATKPKVISVNTALQVDLFGQVNATRIGTRIHSGVGGSTDFLVGAMHSPGGQSLIAMRSWHPKVDRSTIVGRLEGAASANQPTAVVTEQGVAELFGTDEAEQARRLIDEAAHPQARENLRREGVEMGILPG